MKHYNNIEANRIGEIAKGGNYWDVIIKLIHEDEFEIKAIENLEVGNAKEQERDYIEGFIHHFIKGYQTKEIIGQNGTEFRVRAFRYVPFRQAYIKGSIPFKFFQ